MDLRGAAQGIGILYVLNSDVMGFRGNKGAQDLSAEGGAGVWAACVDSGIHGGKVPLQGYQRESRDGLGRLAGEDRIL